MAKRKTTKYTAEFRERAVRLCLDSDDTIAEVARKLEVTYQTLYHWLVKAEKVDQVRGGPKRSPETAEEELRRLRRELDETKMERDFLKKAAAFFARTNK